MTDDEKEALKQRISDIIDDYCNTGVVITIVIPTGDIMLTVQYE